MLNVISVPKKSLIGSCFNINYEAIVDDNDVVIYLVIMQCYQGYLRSQTHCRVNAKG